MIPMPQYKNPISLIPGGCPQLLDYECDKSILEPIKYAFSEVPEKEADGRQKVRLHAFRKNEEGEFVDEMDPARLSDDYGYEINGAKAVLPWLGQWLPVPFLRAREQTWEDDECRFEYGPTNWARCRLVQSDVNPDSFRLVIAFDMQVEEKNPDVYAALTREDVDANAHFKLAWRFRDNAWYMDLAWVEEWLREKWDEYQKKTRRRGYEPEWQFEYLASYLVYLAVINAISHNCGVYVVRPDSLGSVDVDLVLDIGNSRTTGILVETQAQAATNLNDSYLLQLRDMSAPEKIYTDPFETRVEFSEVCFGNDALSMRSGRRSPAFVWPSPVRIGPEAGRLATLSRCEKGSTGMSSPKRYLWDERDWKRSWRYNTGTEKAPYVTRGKLVQEINSSGTPLCCMDDPLFTRNKILRGQERESAFESFFTRSSLMMFLLVEIIQQALLTVNSPGQRLRRDLPAVPRRLRQIIFTVPAGMPMAEQRIYRRWALWAVRVLWEALGWEQFYFSNRARHAKTESSDYRASPIVRCDWDEATCTQLVYIYNEITRKFHGDAMLFCDTIGRRRDLDGKKNVPGVRVAAIDIGGGTTDLSITTFEMASNAGSTPRMAPRPEFHDGFNMAGDDILRDIVEYHVCAAVGKAMGEAGIANKKEALATLFGRTLMDASKDVLDQRVQFVRQIAVPVALCLMSLYEKSDLRAGEGRINFRIGDCFLKNGDQRAKLPPASGKEKEGESAPEAVKLPCDLYPMPNQAALSYVSNYVANNGGNPDFNILDVPITMDPRRIDETVRASLRPVMENLCEVINMYDCDVLLLTGRPSRWPGIIDGIYSLVPLPPGRITPMAEYRVGGWYPFSDSLGNMTDPKTTVVVGAILCALAEGQLEGFSFDPRQLALPSTARYIGEMELTGQIKKEKVWFNVDPESRTVDPAVREINFSAPMSVGFRQLEAERWTTTRYYFLEWASKMAHDANKDNMPLKVRLRLALPEPDSASEDAEATRDEGEFFIEEITGANGDSLGGNVLEMRLQTLPRNEGFWMDTGIVSEA